MIFSTRYLLRQHLRFGYPKDRKKHPFLCIFYLFFAKSLSKHQTIKHASVTRPQKRDSSLFQRFEELPNRGQLSQTRQKILLSGLCNQSPRNSPRFGREPHHSRRSIFPGLGQHPTGRRRQPVVELLVREFLPQ